MKKVLSLLLVFSMLLGLTVLLPSCSADTDNDANVSVSDEPTEDTVWEEVSSEPETTTEPKTTTEQETTTEPETTTEKQTTTEAPVVAPAADADDNNSDTVYITPTGSKYHRSGCRTIKKSSSAISRSNAIAQGYEPCKVCNP